MADRQKRGRILAQMSRDITRGLAEENTAAGRQRQLRLARKAARELIQGTIAKNRQLRANQTTDSNN